MNWLPDGCENGIFQFEKTRRLHNKQKPLQFCILSRSICCNSQCNFTLQFSAPTPITEEACGTAFMSFPLENGLQLNGVRIYDSQ